MQDEAQALVKYIITLQAQLAEGDARIAALTAAGDRLNGYAGHDEQCDAMRWSGDEILPCDCGYGEAWQGWLAAKGENND